MKLKSLMITVVALGIADGVVWWRTAAGQRGAGAARVEGTLLELPQIERAHRIVIREKPQSKVLHKDADGGEVRLVVEKDAPIRETILERREQDRWAIVNCYELEADPSWLGETLRDLTRGRLTRFVASDPALMPDLSLNLGEVRLEDRGGEVIRQLDFGKKDGGERYQFVRIDGRDAFVARHETELVGDTLTWVAGRVFRFEPAEVREIDFPFSGPGEKPLRLTRADRSSNFTVDGAANPTLAQAVGKRVSQMLREPVMGAFPAQGPAAETARKHIAGQLRIALFNGREYTVAYGIVPKGDPAAGSLTPYDEETVAFGFWQCSDSNDLMVRQMTKAAFAYNIHSVVTSLPKDRAALVASLEKPAESGAPSAPNAP